MRSLWFPVVLSAVACSASFDPKHVGDMGGTIEGQAQNRDTGSEVADDDSVDGDTGSIPDDTATDPEGTEPELADLKAKMTNSATGCQDIDGIAIPGAASYFYGELWPDDDDTWHGTEEWVFIANDAWRAQGVSDCTVTWNVRATAVSPGACAACDVSVAVAATVDSRYTSCPEDLWEEYSNYTVQYDVLVDSETGLTHWFFASSGKELGAGSHAAGAMNYVTDPVCVWF
jgi:hypothetical protein